MNNSLEKLSYIADGMTYTVDGKHVVLDASEIERETAVFLSEKYGKEVEIVPKVKYPLGIQTPDYLIDGECFDLKSPKGQGKGVFYNMLSKKRKQASNFIFDITDCPLSDNEITRQIKEIYFSRHTWFVDKIVLMKDGAVITAYKR